MTVEGKRCTPLISVIIPAWNAGATIRSAVTSVQNQTYENLEILIIDDNSTDNTWSIIDSISREDDRVKVYRVEENDLGRLNRRGVNINAGFAARNKGLENASGSWITFQDADDFSLLNRVEIQKELADFFGCLHLSTSYFWLESRWEGRHFVWTTAENYIAQEPPVMTPLEIQQLANECMGVLSKCNLHGLFKWVPFWLKQHRVMAGLFFGPKTAYPGGANSSFFHHSIIDGNRFRPLSGRIWPSDRGRGADRDFCFNVAKSYGSSVFVDVPLYAWRTPTKFPTHWDLGVILREGESI